MGNIGSSGSSHYCCCCCYCCLDEGEKVGLVLKRFTPMSCVHAIDDNLMLLVGRVVLAAQPFYAPASGMPCVWYHVTVEEELIKTRTVTETINNEQRTRTETYQEWRTIVDEQAMSDFYLQDGATKVFINGSKAGFGKIQSVRDASASTSIFSQPPPGIQYLIGRHLGNAWNWMANQGRTGRFRYTQSSFDVNELVAALGVVRAGIDPMTSQPLKILDPITSNALTPKFMADQKWEDWDKQSWEELVSRGSSVLLSDQHEFTGNLQLPKVPDLPPYMLHDPNRDLSKPQFYAPGGANQH